MASTPDVPLQTRIVDDKSPKCVPFILERLQAYQAASPTTSSRPFIIGLNGVQGVGKTTLVRALAETLQERRSLQTLVLSIDDFYLRHADQLRLAASQPDNALVQVRGEPGTHDVALLRDVFNALSNGEPTLIPAYDKGAYNGLGERLPESQWTRVNHEDQPRVQVVILEGWCVGFRGVSHDEIQAKWLAPSRTLALHQLDDLFFINDQLKGYEAVTNLLDAFIHIDAEDTEYVYGWRLEQEQVLRRERGIGMTDEQVIRFVDAYYPAYELFSDGMRSGIFRDRKGCQLRLIVDKYRMVVDTIVI